MAIPYRTTKFKYANILAIAILGSTTKFNFRNITRGQCCLQLSDIIPDVPACTTYPGNPLYMSKALKALCHNISGDCY